MEKKGGGKHSYTFHNKNFKRRTLKLVSAKPTITSRLSSKVKRMVKTIKILNTSNLKNENIVLNTFELILKLIIKNDQKLTYQMFTNNNHKMNEELNNFDMFIDEINDKLDTDILNKIKNKSNEVYEQLNDSSVNNSNTSILKTIELYARILKKLRMMRKDKSLSKSLIDSVRDVQVMIANDLNEKFAPVIKKESKANNGLNGLASMFKSLQVKEDSSIDDLMDSFKSLHVER
jgi:hypothetical protein